MLRYLYYGINFVIIHHYILLFGSNSGMDTLPNILIKTYHEHGMKSTNNMNIDFLFNHTDYQSKNLFTFLTICQ